MQKGLNEAIAQMTQEQRAEMKRKGAEYLEKIMSILNNPLSLMLRESEIFEWITVRACAEVLGIENTNTEHQHRCPKDGTTWRHDSLEAYWGDPARYARLHDCPACGYNVRTVDIPKF